MSKNIKIITVSLILSFFILAPSFSAKLPIGDQCTSNSDCKSNDCELSTQKDDKGDKKSFCDCGELDLSIASGDYSNDCVDRYGGTKDDWTCKDGADGTWDLDYCLHNADINKTKYPISPKDPSFTDHILDPSFAYDAIYDNEIENIVKRKPILQIGIPGLTSFLDGKTTEDSGNTYVHIPFLSQYLAALYRYGVVVASIIAVVMVINNGLKWSISGGSPEKIKEAQTRIVQSITGLLLAVGSYALLYNINPELVQFRNLRVQTVVGVPLTEMDKYLIAEGSLSPDTGVAVSGGPTPTAGTGTGKRGPWRTEMFSSVTCGNKKNGSLPMDERKKALAKVIRRWKHYSADEGGAVYVHGGKANCSYSGASVKFLMQQWAGVISRGETSSFSPSFLSSSCGKLITKVYKDIGLKGKHNHDGALIEKWMGHGLSTQEIKDGKTNTDEQKDNYELAQKCTKTKVDNRTDGTERIPSFPRTYRWKLEYDYLLTKRADNSNMVCGDCGTFLVGLYHDCFDNSYDSKFIKTYDGGLAKRDKKTLRFSTTKKDMVANTEKYVAKLQFGDMIRTTSVGHFMIYTGKSESIDKNIDFEILEMGGGGRGDVKGDKQAKINSGTPLRPSGVKSHNDAIKFFKEQSMGYTNIQAYGVIDKL
ncbi:MAG: hypothetical protein HOA57_00115 [Candidatus Magasanikbacteria bacterium]|nr:hypothetical protein [Candidatus Magasanikbacteria bacterium]